MQLNHFDLDKLMTTSNGCEFRTAHLIKVFLNIAISTYYFQWSLEWVEPRNGTNDVHETELQDPRAASQVSRS